MKKREPLTEEQLAAIKARAEAATPGPWQRFTPYGIGVESGNGPVPLKVAWAAQENDAAFISAAREDVPALLEEVERLRKQLDGLKKIAAFSMGCTSHPQWEKKYKLQWGMENFEKIGIDNVIKNFRKFYRDLPF